MKQRPQHTPEISSRPANSHSVPYLRTSLSTPMSLPILFPRVERLTPNTCTEQHYRKRQSEIIPSLSYLIQFIHKVPPRPKLNCRAIPALQAKQTRHTRHAAPADADRS